MKGQGIRRARGKKARTPKVAEHKRVGLKLKESEKLRVILDSSPDAIVVTDLKGNITECNRAALDVAGFSTKKELLGKNAFDFFTPKDRQRAAEDMEKTLKQGIVQDIEYALLARDGHEYPVELSASLIRDSSGTPSAFVAIIKDITERKLAEEKLRESEGRFRDTLDKMLEGCQIISYDWRYLYVNEAVARHGRTTREKLLGKTMMEMYPGIEKTEMFSTLQRCMRERISAYMENKFEYPDSEKAWFELSIHPVPEGIFILSIDITQRKQMEEALKESEEKHRTLVENASDLIFMINEKYRVLSLNRSAAALFRKQPEEIVGSSIFDLFPNELAANYARNLKEVFQTGESRTYESKMVAEGREMWISTSLSPVRSPEGKVTAVIGVTRDLTERKRMDDELRIVNRTLGVLSACNQALIRAEDEQDLLNDICRTIVRVGGYRMAWVGFAEQDEEKTVRPVARWGHDVGYLNTVRFTWADTELGRTPTGKVIRTGKPRVVNNILTEPEYPPRVEATKRGYASQVSLPLTANGKAFGVLSVYATKPDAFDTEEVNLLIELANDLSYGVTALRMRAERKKAEEQIKQIQEYLQLQVDRMPIGLIAWDTEFRVKTWNPSAARIFGFSESEALGKHPYDFIVPKQAQPHVDTIWRRLLEGDETAHSVNENLTKDDRTIICDWTNTPLKSDDGTVIGILSMVQDVTQSKQMEDALKASEEKLRRVFEASPDAITVIDSNGTIISCNQATVNLHGFSKDELIGKNALELIAKKYHEEAMEKLKKVFEQGSMKNVEYPLLTKDGREFPAELSASVILDEYGKPTAIVVISKDITERRRLEEAKLRAEAEAAETRIAKETVEGMMDAVIINDLEGRIVQFNRPFTETFGWGEEAIGKLPTELVVEKDVSRVTEAVKECFEKGYLRNFEPTMVTKGGKEVPVLVSATLKRDSEGNPIGLITVIKDITERKRAEEALRKSEAKSKAILNATPDLMFRFTREGIFLDYKPSAELYVPPEEFMGKKVSEVMPPELVDLLLNCIGKTLDTGTMQTCEYQLPSPQGLQDYEARLVVSGPDEVLAVVRNITERKRFERALWESEERYRDLFENANDLIQSITPDGRFAYVNRAWRETLGYDEKEIAGLSMLDIIHPDSRAHSIDVFQRVMSGETVDKVEAVFVAKNGKKIIVEGTANCRIIDGKPVSTRGIFRDVTERKKIEEERQRLQEDKSRFVSAATHELKTPLAAIKGYADLLTRGTLGETPQPVKDSLTVILRNTDRMLHLIGELLDIQRMEDGRLKHNVETVNLAEAVKQTIQDLTPIINSKKLQLELLLHEADLNVPGDKIRLQEIMDNLLTNAIKYTPENGKIKITVTEEADQLRVSITDIGIGISPEHLPHIFDPFSKIPKTRYTGNYGTFGIYETGLGLNITKHLVEMHGGKIWAESEGEGKGSTFTFTIPREVKKIEK